MGKIILAAMVLEVVDPVIVQRWVYPLEAILVAFILAIVPYFSLRSIVNRAASRKNGKQRERI